MCTNSASLWSLGAFSRSAKPRRLGRALWKAGLGAVLALSGIAVVFGQESPPPPAPGAPADAGKEAPADDLSAAAEGSGEVQDAKEKAVQPRDPFDEPLPAEPQAPDGPAKDPAQEADAAPPLKAPAPPLKAPAKPDLPSPNRDKTEGPPDSAREAPKGELDAAREAREGQREDRDDLQGAARSPGERGSDRYADPRDRQPSPRDDVSGLRGEGRDARDNDRDSSRSRTSSRESIRSSSRIDSTIRSQNLRSADLGLWFGRADGQQLVISDVATTGPMARLISQVGFRPGDQIISVAGYRVSRESDFMRYLLADDMLHQQVPVVVWRGGREVTLHIEPIQLIEQTQVVEQDPLEQFGVVLDDRIPNRAVVWKVVPQTPAFYAGIRPGDVITTFHTQLVSGPDSLVQLVESAGPGTIAVEVNRDQQLRQFDVELPQLAGRPGARTALRPEYDDPNIERLSERREERIEDRQQMRMDDNYFAPPEYRSATGPVRRLLFPRRRF